MAALLLLLLLSRFSRVRLCDPIDGSPPGSSIHGIFQARVLEWGAIAFSGDFPYFLLFKSEFGNKVHRASLVAQLVRNPPAVQETPVQFLGQEDPLEKG